MGSGALADRVSTRSGSDGIIHTLSSTTDVLRSLCIATAWLQPQSPDDPVATAPGTDTHPRHFSESLADRDGAGADS